MSCTIYTYIYKFKNKCRYVYPARYLSAENDQQIQGEMHADLYFAHFPFFVYGFNTTQIEQINS